MQQRPKITEFRFDAWADDLKKWIQESVSPFEDDSPEKQSERKDRARWDKLFFMKTYLPHYFSTEFGDFHEDWASIGDMRNEVALVAAPREHAKSTFFTFGDLIHDVCYLLRRFILVISDTNDQATGFTLPIRLELEENVRIRHDFGDLTGPIWQRSDFTTANGVKILARGHGEKVRGLKNRQYRPDKAVVDDFENDTNVENPKLVNKGIQWLRDAVIGSMGEGYIFLMIGNLFHPKSVLSQLIAAKDEDGNPMYFSRVYDAILDEGTCDERPLWPALWPMERLLAKKKKVGTVSFNKEMRNKCGAEESPFREAWFKYFERIEITRMPLLVATAVDPSAKSGENNDYKAVVTVGLERVSMVYRCLHAWIRKASIGEMFAAAYAQHKEYGGPVGIEENMLHDFLHEAIANYAKQVGSYLPWNPVIHNTNKEGRIIGTCSYLVEYGKLLFEKGHSDQDVLVEQLIYILNSNIHDDGPDALETSISMIQAGGFIGYASTGVIRTSAGMENF